MCKIEIAPSESIISRQNCENVLSTMNIAAIRRAKKDYRFLVEKISTCKEILNIDDTIEVTVYEQQNSNQFMVKGFYLTLLIIEGDTGWGNLCKMVT